MPNVFLCHAMGKVLSCFQRDERYNLDWTGLAAENPTIKKPIFDMLSQAKRNGWNNEEKLNQFLHTCRPMLRSAIADAQRALTALDDTHRQQTLHVQLKVKEFKRSRAPSARNDVMHALRDLLHVERKIAKAKTKIAYDEKTLRHMDDAQHLDNLAQSHKLRHGVWKVIKAAGMADSERVEQQNDLDEDMDADHAELEAAAERAAELTTSNISGSDEDVLQAMFLKFVGSDAAPDARDRLLSHSAAASEDAEDVDMRVAQQLDHLPEPSRAHNASQEEQFVLY